MNICAVICEYNPFHNGHQYHIKESIKATGCDAVLCIMGGNFTQRGEPAITDKYTRATMAIKGGADAVVQIPAYFCSTNAEVFALTAVKIAASFENVTHLSFGSECGDIQSITELARFLNHEPKFYKEKIRKNLEQGYSLGMSKTKALSECIQAGLAKFTSPKVVEKLLDSPNNILGVEYVKALLALPNKKITPVTIKRREADSEIDMNFDYKLTTATSIRKSLIDSKHIWNIRKFIPPAAYQVFATRLKEVSIPDLGLWGKLALGKFRTSNTAELKLNYDVAEGIENKLIQAARENVDYAGFLEAVGSRRYTQSRIQRMTVNTMLNFRAEFVKHIYEIDKLPYLKLLAIKENKELISALRNCGSVLVTRKQDALIAQKDPYAKILMYAEDRANSLYALLLSLEKDAQRDIARVSDIYTKTLFL